MLHYSSIACKGGSNKYKYYSLKGCWTSRPTQTYSGMQEHPDSQMRPKRVIRNDQVTKQMYIAWTMTMRHSNHHNVSSEILKNSCVAYFVATAGYSRQKCCTSTINFSKYGLQFNYLKSNYSVSYFRFEKQSIGRLVKALACTESKSHKDCSRYCAFSLVVKPPLAARRRGESTWREYRTNAEI